MMRSRTWDLIRVTTVIAIAAGIMIIRNPRSATALQGTICGDYNLPKGAQVHQTAINFDSNGNKIMILVYEGPDGRAALTIPFNTVAATCADPIIRGEVAHLQELDREMLEASCKFVGDLLAGRVQSPPYYDRKYAEDWYRKTCLGRK